MYLDSNPYIWQQNYRRVLLKQRLLFNSFRFAVWQTDCEFAYLYVACLITLTAQLMLIGFLSAFPFNTLGRKRYRNAPVIRHVRSHVVTREPLKLFVWIFCVIASHSWSLSFQFSLRSDKWRTLCVKLHFLASLEHKPLNFYEEEKCFDYNLWRRIKKPFCKYTSCKSYSFRGY